MFRLTISIAFSFLFFSCNNTASSNVNRYSDLSPTDTIPYSYKTFKVNSPYFVASHETVDTTFFTISYPIFAEEKLNDSLKKYILFDGEQTAAEAGQSFIDGFDEFIGDSAIENVNAAWFKEVDSRVLVNSPLLITLVTQVNEYSGGAHGQHLTFFSNYDIHNAQTIALKDILQKDTYLQLTKIAEKYFRKHEKLSAKESLSKDFFFEDGIFTLNDNFGLTKKSLIIYYNEYEIRPYSDGPTKIEIPYTELVDIINTRGQEYIQSIL